MTVTMVPVESTNVKALGYDALLSELHVAFHDGDTYVFEGVPAQVHIDLMAAKSKGSAFHKMIRTAVTDNGRPKYPYHPLKEKRTA